MSCAICHERKEKRFCLAVHDRICSICCGTEREVTLDCPSDCPYLQQARKHEAENHLSEVDPAALLPEVEVREAIVEEQDALVHGMSFAVAQVARRQPGIYDRDVIQALTAMAKTYQTQVNTGLIYQQPTENSLQQAIAGGISQMLQEYHQMEEQRRGYSTLKDSDILKVLVFTLRVGLAKTSGRPKSRAFLDFLLANFPEKPLAGVAGESRIIVP